MSPLQDHPLLGVHYARGLAAGRAFAQNPAPLPQDRPTHKAQELLWSLLVHTPLRDEAEALMAMAGESGEMLPALHKRACREGFADGLREHVGAEVARRFRPPARWPSLLRQSNRQELAAMLLLLPRCRTWSEFFARAVVTG